MMMSKRSILRLCVGVAILVMTFSGAKGMDLDGAEREEKYMIEEKSSDEEKAPEPVAPIPEPQPLQQLTRDRRGATGFPMFVPSGRRPYRCPMNHRDAAVRRRRDPVVQRRTAAIEAENERRRQERLRIAFEQIQAEDRERAIRWQQEAEAHPEQAPAPPAPPVQAAPAAPVAPAAQVAPAVVAPAAAAAPVAQPAHQGLAILTPAQLEQRMRERNIHTLNNLNQGRDRDDEEDFSASQREDGTPIGTPSSLGYSSEPDWSEPAEETRPNNMPNNNQ